MTNWIKKKNNGKSGNQNELNFEPLKWLCLNLDCLIFFELKVVFLFFLHLSFCVELESKAKNYLVYSIALSTTLISQY